ncbi:MAG TPA: amidohydrolase family protein [Tepidisphaeraceae bacterium]|nr:amidohydrolase family protein [Tepidisphaeraceae bacterium]
MTIDSHHHFWRYNDAEYGWMNHPGMERIRRDFLPADLLAQTRAAGVDGVVSVQARQTLEETDALLAFAEQHDFIRGVVGWVPLVSLSVETNLAGYAARAKLKGVRHVLHDEADDDYMLRDDFDRGVSALRAAGELRYDILIFERHLPQSIRLVDRHPNQVFIVDHVAKPKIKAGVLSPWRENIRELGRRQNVYCKISGMVTEADWNAWTPEQLRPYVDVVLEAFGPRRVMFGSDWPVCLVACDYGRWVRTVQDFIAPLSVTEQSRIMGATAIEAYRLDD